MILGIGIDLVHLPRIAAVIERRTHHRFARRILSPSEFEHWSQIGESDIRQRVRFLAVRWAVKEAAYKALYPTVKASWKDFTYHSLGPSGRKPFLSYAPLTRHSEEEIGPIHVSVSHDGEYAVAYVIAESGVPRTILQPMD